MNRVLGGSVFLVAITAAVAASAQSPMTPSRLNAPTPGSTSWVEPPASPKPPAISGTTAAVVPAALPERQATSQAEQRPARRATRVSRPSSDSVADRLNRQELNRVRSGGGYYRGYSSGWGY
jgi:hypothetical protein